MSTPPRPRHVPGLDGLRGLAVVGVLLFHAGHLEGGYLGVDLFFVLSGFLITSLLVAEWDRSGTLDLRRFWSRRLRRLLPAALVVLVATSALAATDLTPDGLARYRWDAVAALGNVANWRAIASSADYWAELGTPSPLRHMWSLSIEEQLYVTWPLVVLGALVVGARRRLGRQALLVTALALTAASVATMAWFGRDGDVLRAYYGTDTRASAVLIGALVAIGLSGRSWDGHQRVPALLGRLSVVAAGVLGAAWLWADGESRWLYLGGLPALSAAGAVVVAATALGGGGPLRAVFELAPLQVLGRISYGVYLWHWPVYVALDEDDLDVGRWGLTAVRVAVTLVVAGLSYVLVEQPIRTGRVPTFAWRVLGATGVAVVLVGVGLATTDARSAPRSGAEVIPSVRPGQTTVLVLGDSQAYSLFYGGEVVGDDVALGLHSRVGCGIGPGLAVTEGGIPVVQDLEREPCRNANDRLYDAVDRFEPDILLVHEGAWDVLDRRLGDEDVVFGTARWDEAVRANLAEFLERLAGSDRRVYLLAVPCYPPGGEGGGHTIRSEDRRVHRWNELAREVAPEVGVEELPYDELFCDVPVVEQPERRDSVHLTEDGAAEVWRWIAPRIGIDVRPG